MKFKSISRIAYLSILSDCFEKQALFKAGINFSFPSEINFILDTKVSRQEVDNWFIKNKAVLKDYLDEEWHTFSNQETGENFLRAFFDNGIDAIISTINKKPSDLDITESAVLQKEGPIPQLWLFLGKKINNPAFRSNLDVAHNQWLVEAIIDLFGNKLSPSLLKKITEFIKDNKSKIDEIRALFSGQPKLLGAGADGIAFAINNKQVLKIFRSKFAFEKNKEAWERLHKNPEIAKTEAMIYDVGILGIWKSILGEDVVYYSIIEKMQSQSFFEKNDIQHALTYLIKSLGLTINSKSKILNGIKSAIKNKSISDAEVKTTVQFIANKILNDCLKGDSFFGENVAIIQESVNVKPNWLPLLVEELIMKYLTGRMDVHVGNIGLTDYGEFRYFDPAYEEDLYSNELNVGST